MSRTNVIRFTVKLNGTDENPYRGMGLTQNPFPQVAIYPYSHHLLRLQQLGGEPIPDTDYIKEHLAGWSPEFVELCCQQFKKGEIVQFDVSFEESRPIDNSRPVDNISGYEWEGK